MPWSNVPSRASLVEEPSSTSTSASVTGAAVGAARQRATESAARRRPPQSADAPRRRRRAGCAAEDSRGATASPSAASPLNGPLIMTLARYGCRRDSPPCPAFTRRYGYSVVSGSASERLMKETTTFRGPADDGRPEVSFASAASGGGGALGSDARGGLKSPRAAFGPGSGGACLSCRWPSAGAIVDWPPAAAADCRRS